MENQNIKRGRGRPTKHVTNEEKLIMGRVYCKKFNDNPDNKYYCIKCNKYFHPAAKSKHNKSKIHHLNSQIHNNE